MSKNMTRKGLALAAISALAASAFVSLPASAAGITGSVSLAPNSGSNYAVLLGQSFSLKSNSASSITGTGKYLKFLVADTNSSVTTTSGQYNIAPTAATGQGAADTLTVTVANHKFKQGDKVSLTGVTYVSTGTAAVTVNTQGSASPAKEDFSIAIAGTYAVGDIISVANAATGAVTYTVTAANLATGTAINNIASGLLAALAGADGAIYENNGSSGATVTMDQISTGSDVTDVATTLTRVNLAAVSNVAISAVATGGTGTITIPAAVAISGDVASGGTYSSALATISTSGNRAANLSYVVDTKTDVNTSNRVLALTTASTTAQSATVTAWVDDNDDNLIDTTEYQSASQTVSFVPITSITPTVTLSPVTTGDTALTATISTSPALNGEQVGNTSVGAVFTRQDSVKELAKLATYNVDTELWEVSVGLEVGSVAGSPVLYGTATAGNWGFTNPTTRSGVDGTDSGGTDGISSIAVSTAGVVTVTTSAAHDLRTGDKITMVVDADDSTVEIAEETTAVSVTATGTSSFTYSISETTLPTAALSDLDLQNDTDYTIATYSTNGLVTRAFPGSYSAKFAANTKTDIAQTTARYLTKVGSAVTNGAAVATAASLSVDAVEGSTAGKTGADATDVLNGTTSASVTVTVLTSTGAAAAGVSVKGSVNGAPTGSGVFTLNSAAAANGTVAYVTTNAAGQATFTVTNSVAAIGDAVALAFTTEGLTAVNETLTWNDAQYRIVDLNDASAQADGIRDRFAVTGASHTFSLAVIDQYRNAAPAAFGLLSAVTERAVSTGYIELTAGRVSLTVTDGGLGANGYAEVDLQIVKKVAGVWTTPADADVVNWDQAYSTGVAGSAGEQAKVRVNFVTQTDKITLNANAASSPNTATAADLAATVATIALTESDFRLVGGSAPSYAAANKGVVSGSVANSLTGAVNKGAVVTATLAGALFKVGNVWKKDSISLLTDASGFFAVDVYAATSGSKKVVISSGNATDATATVVYTGIAGTATLTVTSPAAVKPATTFTVSAKLADEFGNPVDTAAGAIKVTYTGSGIVFGTLPTETDSTGSLSFAVLLGSNDSANAVITVSYDQNADGDFVDAKDLNVTSTTQITASGVASSAAKVNAGSFKGYVALYAKGYKGQRMSAKVGKDWVVVASLASDFERVVEFTGAGVDVAVRIYIDRVLMDTINLTTK